MAARWPRVVIRAMMSPRTQSSHVFTEREGFVMWRHAWMLSGLVLAVVGSSPADDADGFRPLFDGKSLAGWSVVADKPGPDDEWTWKDGVLVAKPASSWLKSN